MMNLVKLEVIVLIAKYKKVTAVADAMGVSQPTVTFHMKSLEKEFGVQLFEMRTGKVLLTDAGTALLHYASKIQALTQEAHRVVEEYRTMRKGTLTIGASYVPGTYILPDLMNRFSETYPGITFRMFIKPAPAIRSMLLDHSIDIGFISSQPFEDPMLHQIAVCDDELGIALPANHPLAGQPAIDPQAIASERFIYHGTESTTRQMTEQWAANYGLRLRIAMELDSLEAIKRAVMLGEGISFISRMSVADEVKRGLLALLPLPGSFPRRSVYACYHRDRWLSSQMKAFLDTLQGNSCISLDW